MSWSQKKSKISGNAIIDGTIQGDQLADDTITGSKIADNTIAKEKLKGATAEQYTARLDETTSNIQRYATQTIMTFEFPATEGNVKKNRTLDFSGYATGYSGTSTDQMDYFRFSTEVKKPHDPLLELIGTATHVSNPRQYWQLVKFDGDVSDKIYGTSIGDSANTRSLGLTYTNSTLGSEILSNNSFNGGLADWTFENDTNTSASNGLLTIGQGDPTKDAVFYQEFNIEDGAEYVVEINSSNGNSSRRYKAYISPTSNYEDGFEVIEEVQGNITAEARAYGTSAYIIIRLIDHSTGQQMYFTDVSVKKRSIETFVELSAYPSNFVPSGTPTDLYAKPYGTSSTGSYVVFDYNYNNMIAIYYNGYAAFSHTVNLGKYHERAFLRIRVYNRFYQYIKIFDTSFRMTSI